ncbi:MAG: hypothetical protein JJU28_09735 [Cyclobacteriaceae bacterium]|nr:hypothetical protein [Cyclobacteriaceae bacterium]
MTKLTSALIKELLAVNAEPCISLYMPTHRSHPENIQDTIRFKNLLKKVRESLTEKFSNVEIADLMEPMEALGENKYFWNFTTDGLAILRSPEIFLSIHLLVPVGELAIVANTFHTRPLRRYLQSADRYMVLGLSQHEFHLYEGNRHALCEVELPNEIPTTIEAALGDELTEKRSTVASYGGVSGESSNMHHGHGGKKDEVDIDAERFFRHVAKVIQKNNSVTGGLPIILAALPEHHDRFQQVNENPNVLPTGIKFNPKSVSIKKLAELAWEVMQPVHLLKLTEMVEKYNEAKANDLGSDSIDEVIGAAEEGRVSTLLIEEGRIIAERLRNQLTGTFKPIDLTQPKLDDLLDDIGELVNNRGGTVLIIPQTNMPSKTGLAAIYRY